MSSRALGGFPSAAHSRRPQKADQVLSAALRKFGIDKELARYNFVLHWEEIVGREIARRSRPECLRNGALVVRVCDSAWAQELSFQREVILQRLQRFLGAGDVVSDVRFCVGEIPRETNPCE